MKSMRFLAHAHHDWVLTIGVALVLVLAPTVTGSLGAQQRTTLRATGPAPAIEPLAFTGVTVIDVTNGQLRAGQVVVIVGRRIQTIGPSGQVAVPRKARVVDARGKFMLPGLWDMHAHPSRWYGDHTIENMRIGYEGSYPLYIASGVTGIREPGLILPMNGDTFRVWQRQVTEGQRIGPRAVTGARVTDPEADGRYDGEVLVRTPQDAARVVDSLKAAGDPFLKVYFQSQPDSRELFFAVLREARKVGLPAFGHVPSTVRTTEALDSGLRSVEHINQNHDCSVWSRDQGSTVTPMPDDSAEAEQQCRPLVQAYIRNGAWLTPTFRLSRGYPREDAFMRLMIRLGLRRFLAGSDCYHVLAGCQGGIWTLQEVVDLQKAGLTPLEALQTATLNPAQFFNATDSLGTVEAGKLADLVLLDADPLADIHNIRKTWAVVADGRYYDRAALTEFEEETEDEEP